MNTFRKRAIFAYKRAYRDWLSQCDFVDKIIQPYYREYLREVKGFQGVSTPEELNSKIQEAEIVYFGDFHPLRGTKLNFRDYVKEGRNPQKQTLLALEDFFPSDQQNINLFLSGRIDEEDFRKKTGMTKGSGSSSVRGLIKILELAREEGFKVYGIDEQDKKPKTRGRVFAERISELYSQHRDAQIFVLAGDDHVAPSHVPYLVRRMTNSDLSDLVVFQNATPLFWQLMQQGLENSASVVKVNERCYNLNHTPPLLSLMVYDNTCLPGPERVSSGEVLEGYVNVLAGVLRESLGFEEDCDPITVFSAQDRDLSERIRELNAKNPFLDEGEVRTILAYAQRETSFSFPGRSVIYLANDDMPDIAEEISHVLNRQVSLQKNVPLHPADGFYYGIIKEAIGYFGSKILDPSRSPITLEELSLEYGGEDFLPRMHQFLESHTRFDSTLHPDRIYLDHFEEMSNSEGPCFDPVTHYFGFGLGEKLYRQIEQGEMPERIIPRLFKKRFDKPGEAFAEYVRLRVI